MPAKIAIVGAGITGLSAAYTLEKLGEDDITIFESSRRLGGKVYTNHIKEFLVEEGPDCFFTRKEGALSLIHEIGLESELVAPKTKEFGLFTSGKLHRVPGGLVTFTHLTPNAINDATFLSPEGKARTLAEADQMPGQEDDESIESFFTRRFGPEFYRLAAEPLLAGTHGGDGGSLSMRALYPGYFRLERSYGSLTAGMQETKASHPKGISGSAVVVDPNLQVQSPPHSSFLTFSGGMGTLVEGIAAQFKHTKVRLNSPISDANALSDLEQEYDRVLVAVPANAAVWLLPEFRYLLEQIRHKSSAIVTFSVNRKHILSEMNLTGFLIPKHEQGALSGATWSSEKWSHRAPAGQVLMRAFLAIDEEQMNQADDEHLARLASDAIRQIITVSGPMNPLLVTRWNQALPQYKVGHLDLLDSLRNDLRSRPKIFLAGTSYGGIGVPDCLRQGKEAAYTMLDLK